MVGNVQKRLSPEPLNSYSPVVQWYTARLMLIFLCIIGFQSQSINFINAFYWAVITSGKTVFIEIPRDFKIDGVQCDVVIRLEKRLYIQAEATCIWY